METEVIQKQNTAIAASGSELISPGGNHTEYNSLLVTNNDKVDITIRLNCDTFRSFVVKKAGGTLEITPQQGVWFRNFLNVNNDSNFAQTAGAIIFRIARGA